MNIGIVGNGMIIENAGAAIISQPDFNCAAIVCRPGSRDKAAAYAEKFCIPHICTNYQEFLQDNTIEAVYIGIINSEHYPYARQALLAGKHVILEKPFTITFQQAEELARISRHTGKYLLEAIHLRYHPWMEAVRRSLGEIGKIKVVQACYSKVSGRYEQYLKGNVLPAFAPGLGGGALMDLGVYGIHFINEVMGTQEPEKVFYMANQGFNGVDTSGVLTVRYPGAIAVCTCGKDSDGGKEAVIQGEKGCIQLESFPRTTRVFLRRQGEEKGEIIWEAQKQKENPLENEFHEFARILKEQDREAAEKALESSLRVMKILDSALKGNLEELAENQKNQ